MGVHDTIGAIAQEFGIIYTGVNTKNWLAASLICTLLIETIRLNRMRYKTLFMRRQVCRGYHVYTW
jgi:hypothetical protein